MPIIEYNGVQHEFPDSFTDADIAAALEQFDAEQQTSAAAPAQPAAASTEPPLPPGLLTAIGATTGLAAQAAPGIVSRAGTALMSTRKLPMALAGTVGASLGAKAGSMVGGFPIGTLGGGTLGAKTAMEGMRRVLPAIKSAGETLKMGADVAKGGDIWAPTWPTMARTSAGGIRTVARGLTGLSKAAGPIGLGLTILDLINMGGPKILDALRARGHQFNAGDPNAPLGDLAPQSSAAPPDDELLQQLLLRISPTASH